MITNVYTILAGKFICRFERYTNALSVWQKLMTYFTYSLMALNILIIFHSSSI